MKRMGVETSVFPSFFDAAATNVTKSIDSESYIFSGSNRHTFFHIFFKKRKNEKGNLLFLCVVSRIYVHLACYNNNNTPIFQWSFSTTTSQIPLLSCSSLSLFFFFKAVFYIATLLEKQKWCCAFSFSIYLASSFLFILFLYFFQRFFHELLHHRHPPLHNI